METTEHAESFGAPQIILDTFTGEIPIFRGGLVFFISVYSVVSVAIPIGFRSINKI